jgi:hypothetical protein
MQDSCQTHDIISNKEAELSTEAEIKEVFEAEIAGKTRQILQKSGIEAFFGDCRISNIFPGMDELKPVESEEEDG